MYMSTLFERTAGGLQVRGKQDMEIKRLNRLLPNFLPAVKLGLSNMKGFLTLESKLYFNVPRSGLTNELKNHMETHNKTEVHSSHCCLYKVA